MDAARVSVRLWLRESGGRSGYAMMAQAPPARAHTRVQVLARVRAPCMPSLPPSLPAWALWSLVRVHA